jgi:hypothetical protein
VGALAVVASLVAVALVARGGLGARGAGAGADTGTPSLAVAASRVAPGRVSYVVEHAGAQVGYASSAIDTTPAGLTVSDVAVTELPIGGKLNRVDVRLRTELTRALALRAFTLDVESASGPLRVSGRPEGDSVLVLAVSANGLPADTQRVAITGPLLLPSVVPLVVGLGEPPRLGRRYALTTFDPLSLAPRQVRLAVRAESLFVITDSAARSGVSRPWRAARSDTLRAFQLVPDSGTGFSGWVAADGRVVRLEQPGGFALQRTARELARDNWTLAAGRRRGAPLDADILESTAIGASARLRNGQLARVRVRLGNVDLAGFEVVGERQRLRGDTLVVTRDSLAGLDPGFTLPADATFRGRFARELGAEPLLQVDAPEIRAASRRIVAGAASPREAAERINRWLYDSLRKEITIGVPSALQVLAARSGDCNEHTQLYLALARAAGIPARGAAGLARVGRKFYYHAWPEVYLGRWVAVDPTFGEFPADAGHLRFVTGGLGRQAELLRLIGTLQLDVVDSR